MTNQLVTPAENQNVGKRIHCIDNARGIASLLGLVFHTTLIFSAPWIVNAEVLTDKLLFIVYKDYLNLFRMPLFWLVSGHFSMVSMRKMPLLKFCKNRLMRLGIPMLTTMFFLGIVPTIVLQNLGVHEKGTATGTLNPLDKGFFASHIWFINYALLFSLTAVGAYWLIFKRHPKLAAKFKTFIEETPHPLMMILIGSTIGYSLLNLVAMRVQDPGLQGLFKVYANNAIYFAVGLIVGLNYNHFSQKVLNVSWRFFIQSTALAGLLLWLRHHANLTLYLSDLCLILARLSLLYVAMFLIYRYLNRTNRVLKYLADASYPVYLLHQPIIAITATVYFTIERGILAAGNPYLDFSIILVVATLLTYAFEYLLVRKFGFTRFLMTGQLKRQTNQKKLQPTH